MKDKGIRLHPQHGVNPTIPTCWLCGKSKNEVVLLGAAYKEQAPMHMVLDKQPCEECVGWMEQGVIFISVRDGESGENPYRTGKWCVIKAEAVERWHDLDPGLKAQILKSRVCFIEDTVWKRMGLPTIEIDNRKKKGKK